MKTIDLYKNKIDCCGCEACVNVCPNNIIKMKPDNEGFLYPCIEEEDRCINCKKCLKICPIKNFKRISNPVLSYEAGSCSSVEEVCTSASGGLAAAIYKYFIKHGGICYGVVYEDDYKRVVYAREVTAKGIERFKTSKYVQAEKRFIYKTIEEDIKENRTLVIIGTPCEIAAFRNYFHNNDLIYYIEIICHGPTSPQVLEQYINDLEKRFGNKIKFYSCRYKKEGQWKPYYSYAKFNNGIEFLEVFALSDFGIAFQHLKRPSCNYCSFKKDRLQGDITIGDYHYAHPGMEVYNSHGVSIAVVHNEKGLALLNSVLDFKKKSVDSRSALMNQAIKEPIPRKWTRGYYSKAFCLYGLHAASCIFSVKLDNYIQKTKNTVICFLVKIKHSLLDARGQ